jgi:U32 family peptidase
MQGKKIELLAPAGNFEKFETAIHFGADAVYIGGKDFSLRSHSGNFTIKEAAKAILVAHGQGVKVYVACNVFARNDEHDKIYHYLRQLQDIGPDGVIVADPGIFMAAKEVLGDIPIHISTQANTTSFLSAQFWARQGASRINAARELTLSEIREISSSAPVEVEIFIHGAMCIAWSGRCLLSNYLVERDGNRGLCAHACRWKYHLVEEKRPGLYMPVFEDERGSYFFSARDLCMIDHLPAIIDAGVSSLKIEGRMKGLNYIAATVKTYRQAIDAYYKNPESYTVDDAWRKELESVNYRGYSTGFYMNDQNGTIPVYDQSIKRDDHRYIGKVLARTADDEIIVDIKNRIIKENAVEIIGRDGPSRNNTILRITTDTDVDAQMAQPNTRAALALEIPDACVPGDIVRAL